MGGFGRPAVTALLLDTHTLVWVLMRPDRLSARASEQIGDVDVEVVVSSVSAWEIATKVRLGRFAEADELLPGYARHLALLGSRELSVSTAHALAAGGLDWDHRDPFDRLLVAQARAESLILVTKDRMIRAFDRVATLW